MTKSMLELKRDLMDMIANMQDGNYTYDGYHTAKRLNASYDEKTNSVSIEVEVRGTQFDGRTERIEHLKNGDVVTLIREPDNKYNEFNLAVFNEKKESLGNLSTGVCEVVSPLIDKGLLIIKNATVSYIEPLSQRNHPNAKKALLYIEIKMEMKSIEYNKKNSSIVCILGGDQTRCWAQKLEIIKCGIPLEIAKKLFELHNRYHEEYSNNEFGYLGLDNLADEVSQAREKMRAQMQDNFSYELGISNDDFRAYIKEMVEREPERYNGVIEYIYTEDDEDYYDDYYSLDMIFKEHSLTKETYYWIDQCRVSEDEWDAETEYGFNHWYEIIELYNPDEKLPFDMNDEDIVSIFGFNKFEAFGDLSYGC